MPPPTPTSENREAPSKQWIAIQKNNPPVLRINNSFLNKNRNYSHCFIDIIILPSRITVCWNLNSTTGFVKHAKCHKTHQSNNKHRTKPTPKRLSSVTALSRTLGPSTGPSMVIPWTTEGERRGPRSSMGFEPGILSKTTQRCGQRTVSAHQHTGFVISSIKNRQPFLKCQSNKLFILQTMIRECRKYLHRGQRPQTQKKSNNPPFQNQAHKCLW